MNNKLKQRISKRWIGNQEENDNALLRPPTDLGRVLIALGWGIAWMGAGILLFCWYFGVFKSQFP